MAFKVITHYINDRCFIEIQNTIFDVSEVICIQNEKNVIQGHNRYCITTYLRNGCNFQLVFPTQNGLDTYKNAVKKAMLNLENENE